MRKHSNGFKEEIKLLGRQLDSKIQYTINNKDYILTGEQLISIVPNVNASLLKTIMKQVEVSSTVQIPKNTVINVKSGVKVNNKYEYIDFGNYIVKDNEWDVDTQSYKHLCCDNMLKTMIDYVKLDITYPITVRNYINTICEKCGLVFANKTNKFVNYNKNIKEDYFDYQLYTFRDILDYIAQLVGGFICINSKDELEVRYPTETNEVLDKSYLSDKNVTIKQKYGPINHIIFSRGDGSDNIYRKDDDSINKNGETIIKIKDNPFLEDSDREQFIDGIYEKLNGLYYYVMDIQSTGIMFLEVGDLYDFKLSNGIIAPKSGLFKSGIKKMYATQSGNYKCLLLNDEISISSGLSEMIYTEESEVEVSNYKTSSTTDNSIKNAIIETNKNAGTIVLKANSDGKIVQVELNGNADEKGSTFNVKADNIELTANDILNLIAGNEINLTSKNIAIKSNNFNVDKNGKMTCKNASIQEGSIDIISNENYSANLKISSTNVSKTYKYLTEIFGGSTYRISTKSNGFKEYDSYIASNAFEITGYKEGIISKWNEISLGFNKYASGPNIHNTRVLFDISFEGNELVNIGEKCSYIKDIKYSTLVAISLEEKKKNFEKLRNALDIIKQVDIYKYHLKEQNDNEKKHIGLVIGKNYNYSKEITSKNNDGVDLYSMVSVCFKAIQEQQEIIEQLQNEIKFLKEEFNGKN